MDNEIKVATWSQGSFGDQEQHKILRKYWRNMTWKSPPFKKFDEHDTAMKPRYCVTRWTPINERFYMRSCTLRSC
uniref:Uncharacterized protein n=1 Tax=Megaselia scalaris TaxID=36166 RepID=T1H184_MEGSC